MDHIRAFWTAAREQAAVLPNEFYYVLSLSDPALGFVGGQISHVSREHAARLLVRRSHRLATDDEIAAHLQEQGRRREEYADIERQRLAMFHPGFYPAPAPAPPVAAGKPRPRDGGKE